MVQAPTASDMRLNRPGHFDLDRESLEGRHGTQLPGYRQPVVHDVDPDSLPVGKLENTHTHEALFASVAVGQRLLGLLDSAHARILVDRHTIVDKNGFDGISEGQSLGTSGKKQRHRSQ